MTWTKSADDRRRDAQTYNAEYRRNRKITLERASYRCEIRTGDVCIGRATTVDHIIPASAGGGNALSNLRAACVPCHRRKTAGEGGGSRRRSRTSVDPQPRQCTLW